MNEIFDGTRTIIGVAVVLGIAWTKMLGGRSQAELDKWHIPFKARIWKRFISPTFLGVWICTFALWRGSFHYLYLLSIPLYIGESYIDGYGYNGKSIFLKVLRRLVSALLFSAVGLIFVLASHNWAFFIMQTIIAVTITVGTQFQEGEKAPSEETLIHFGRSFLIPFMT